MRRRPGRRAHEHWLAGRIQAVISCALLAAVKLARLSEHSTSSQEVQDAHTQSDLDMIQPASLLLYRRHAKHAQFGGRGQAGP